MSQLAGIVMVTSLLVGQAQITEVRVPEKANMQLDYFVGMWEVKVVDEPGGTAKWHFEWAPGKACVRCTQIWSDSDGMDKGAGVFAYDMATKQIVYTAFYASGSGGTMRYDDWESGSWKGKMNGVRSNGDILKDVQITLEKQGPAVFLWRASETTAQDGTKLPARQLRFTKVTSGLTSAQLMEQHIKDFGGHWVSEEVAKQAIPGYCKKGDKIRVTSTVKPVYDGQGTAGNWSYYVNGKLMASGQGMLTLDPRSGVLRSSGAWSGGGSGETLHAYKNGKWIEMFDGTLPDGTHFSRTTEITFADGGNTQIQRTSNVIGLDGKPKPDEEHISRRLKKEPT